MAKKKWWMIVAAVVGILGVYGWMPAGVPILAYHSVGIADDVYSLPPEDFEAQMSYLAACGYHAISLDEMVDAWEGKGVLPSKPIVISFDDGYSDNCTVALPIMEKYGMRGTVFMIASQVGQEGYLTWEQLREMAARGTEIGSHTLNHVPLADVSQEEQEMEIRDSKKILEDGIGRPVNFLAYPFGKYDQRLLPLLKEQHYRGACSGKPGLNSGGIPRYGLRRISISATPYGMWLFQLRLWRGEFRYMIERWQNRIQ